MFALGVGTPAGGPVPADSSEAPEKFHRDHIGRIAISRLEEAELRQAAKLTGGEYGRADRPEDRARLRGAIAKVSSRVLSARKSAERADRFQWPLALAVLALLADVALGRRRARPGARWPAAAPARGGARAQRRRSCSCCCPRSRCPPALVARSTRGRVSDSMPPGTTRRRPRRSIGRWPPTRRPYAHSMRATRTTGPSGTRPRPRATGWPPRGRQSSGSRASSISATRSSAPPRTHRSADNCCWTRWRRMRRRCGWIPPIRTPSGTWSSPSSGWRRIGWRADPPGGAARRTTGAAT